MAKKIILALLVLILILVFAVVFIEHNTVDVYLDGENVTVETHTLQQIDTASLNEEICGYTVNVMNDTTSNATSLKSGIEDICNYYGL